jgi:NADPH-dependent 2,4-dienoyl-CoA reductase/sulfur reductase-like enzyme
LRTLDDCLAIRAALDATPGRVVVVGAGFIGAEVAATCRSRGLEVTVVEALPVPLERAVGDVAGALLGEIHRDYGVDVRLGVGVAGFGGGARVEEVRLADGTVIPADLVVVGVGVTPNTEWLEGSGLSLDNGVVCDVRCVAAPGVVAAGDVARWPSPRFGRALRVEHWDNAVTMGEHAGRQLLEESRGGQEGEPYDPVPWFWSDQYDRKIQLAGVAGDAEEMVVVDGSFEERRFAAIYRRGDRIVGVLAMNRPRQVVNYRSLIERNAPWTEALAQATSSS